MELADVTTTAVQGDSPVQEISPEEYEEIDQNILSEIRDWPPHEKTDQISIEDTPGTKYIVEMIDREIRAHVRGGALKESIKVLISGIADMQDEVARIASKQSRTVTAFMGVLEQIDKEQGRKMSSGTKEKLVKKVTIDAPSGHTSYGPNSATRLSNAGLGPEVQMNPGGSESISLYQKPAVKRDTLGEEDRSYSEAGAGERNSTSIKYDSNHLPLNYYVSDVDSLSASKASRFGLGTDPKISGEVGAEWLPGVLISLLQNSLT